MKTADTFEQAFELYLHEIEKATWGGCYWSLLHMVVALPDVCAALERPDDGSQRYYDWCAENFAEGPLTPWDRYQVRCAILHQGTTLPTDRSGKKPTQYTSISFVEPGENGAHLHGHVQPDRSRQGMNLTVNIGLLAAETREAMLLWFRRIESDAARNALVVGNLKSLARRKHRMANFVIAREGGLRVTATLPHYSISST